MKLKLKNNLENLFHAENYEVGNNDGVDLWKKNLRIDNKKRDIGQSIHLKIILNFYQIVII